VLATKQRGVVTCAQLLELGIDRHTIKRWCKAGLLHRMHHGVYAVGHPALTPLAKMQAAQLACGPQAVLSHAAAAFLWGLTQSPPSTLDVTLMSGRCRPKDGVRVHRSVDFDEHALRRRHSLLVTSPARTIIDQAADVTLDELDRLIAEARARRLLRPGELEAALDRAGHRRGAARMRAFLSAEEEPDFTRSKGERRLRGLLRQAGLPQPRTNRRAAGHEVDFLWEAERLVVEFDGYKYHGHRRAFEHDRRKDVELANADYQVLRFTWRQLDEEPLVVIAAIARALGRRGLAVA
jgi:very-short-patch-repair endonuclease